MKQPIAFDKVADIYDFYVHVDFDVPFFMKETEGFDGEILELMCGTGRVSIPLLEAGRRMVCVDYSHGMLDSFRRKIAGKNHPVDLVEMDVTKLKLDRRFGMILLPFHSISEILSAEKQKAALQSIAQHLDEQGTFILTLQNPKTRLQQADGTTRTIGEFPVDDGRKIILSFMNQYNPEEKIVSGHQFYEIYDADNKLIEKRSLEINFRPIEDTELEDMLSDTGLVITEVFGDYAYSPFDDETSNFMIYRMRKES